MPEPGKPEGSCKSPGEREKPRSRRLGVRAAPRGSGSHPVPSCWGGSSRCVPVLCAGPAHRPGLREGYKNKAIPLNGNLSQASPCVSAAALSISALDIMALGGNINNNAMIRHHTILKELTQCYFSALKSLSARSLLAARLLRCLQIRFTFDGIYTLS